MTGHGFFPACPGIPPHGVFAALAVKLATVFVQMPQKFAAFHATVITWRSAPFRVKLKSSSSWISSMSLMASVRLARHSAFVRP